MSWRWTWLILAFVLGSVWVGMAQQVMLTRTSPPKEVLPGDLVTHVFSIKNVSSSPIDVHLSLSFPEGWGLLTPAGIISLAAGEEELLFVTLAVPRTAAAGDYDLTLQATWDGSSATASGQVTVVEIHAVEVVAPDGMDVLPGQTAVYKFSVINRGNLVDRYLMAATSAHGWPVTVTPRELVLAPGERGAVRVTVEVPLGTDVDRDLLEFTAASASRPDVKDSATLFTGVLPPTPELVVGSPYAELRVRAGGDFSGDLLTGSRSSAFSMSASGTLLGGALAFSMRWNGPWSTTPYTLSSLSLNYNRDLVRIRAGDVSLTLTPLLSVAGDGLQVEATLEPFAFGFMSGWQGDEGRTGAKVLAQKNDWEWGIAYREARGTTHSGAADAWSRCEFAEGLTAHFEVGLGYETPYTDRAALVRLTAESSPLLFLQLDAYSVGPHFPGHRSDQEGITLSGRLRGEPVTLRFTAEHRRDNVWHLPLESTVVRSSLNLHFEWAPVEWPMGFSSAALVDRAREEALSPTTDSRTRRLEVGLSGGTTPLSFTLLARWQENEDFVSGTGYHSLEYQERFYLTADPFTATLSLKQESQYELDWTPISHDWTAALTLRSTRSPHDLTFNWTHGADGGRADFSLNYWVNDKFSLKGGIRTAWDEIGIPSSFAITVGFLYMFSWEVPFLPAKGWVEGEVFLDANGNGQRDPGEEGVEGVVLATDRTRVSTNAQGMFKFPPLDPGTYEVVMQRLPLGVRPLVEGPYRVEVAVSREAWLSVPCERLAMIQGVVFEDHDQDGERGPTEPGLEHVVIVLEREGQEIARTTTDKAGSFSFLDLSAGAYRVRVELASLPERYEPTTPAEVELILAQGEKALVDFGVWQRPRPVVVTYQPPFADFVWAPEEPVAGKPVKFDGTGSVDFDGEIVSYGWDFDADGEPDATGPVVEWTFPEPGTYPVSLTVTDNDGYQDTLILEVEVAAGG